jgi:hypothetical protein
VAIQAHNFTQPTFPWIATADKQPRDDKVFNSAIVLTLYRGRSPTSSTPTPDTLPVLSVFEGMQTIHLSIFLISDV